MTLIDPVLAAQIQVPPVTGLGFAAYPDVQPFSQRAAVGYQDQLEGAVAYLRKLHDYLTVANPQVTWDANVSLLIDAVNAALTTQSGDIAQKIADALTAIAESQIQVTDPAFLAVINDPTSASFTRLLALFAPATLVAQVAFLGTFYAPAPSGGDDTALVKTAFDWSQQTGGLVRFPAGTYRFTGYVGALDTQQPRVQGQGKMKTLFTCTSTVAGASFIKLNGTSGPPSDGCLTDLSLIGSDTVPVVLLELAGVCAFDFSRTRFEGVAGQEVQEAVRFHNETAGQFTEFCVGHDVTFGYFTTTAIYYKVTAGNDSFHGSGVDGNTVVNQHDSVAATKGRVVIDAAAKPYNAPLSATFFMSRNEAPIIENHSGLNPHFFGNLRVESSAPNPVAVGLVGGANPPAYYAGTVSSLGEVILGSVYEVDRVSYIGNNIAQKFASRSWNLLNCNGTAQILDGITLAQGVTLVSVEVIAANFYYSYLLAVQKNYTDGNGTATVLSTGANVNTSGASAPTFTVASGTLYVSTNAAGYEVRAHQIPGFSFLR